MEVRRLVGSAFGDTVSREADSHILRATPEQGGWPTRRGSDFLDKLLGNVAIGGCSDQELVLSSDFYFVSLIK